MGYEIFTGHRLEALVDAHRQRFSSPFFGPAPLIVLQNQSLAQWLKLHLAQTLGGYATGDFAFQDEALRRLLGDEKVLFLDELKYALYQHLSQSLAGDDPVFAPLRGNDRPDPARLFELADHIAGVFHHYSMNSDLWPRALAEGIAPRGIEPAAFALQSRLWRDLLVGTPTLAGEVLEKLTRRPPAVSGPPVSVVIVGSAFLSRRASAFLRAWADAGLIDVTHLLLLPASASLLEAPPGRPWSSWGAFGRAFLENLPVPADPEAPPEPRSALEQLQHALLTGTAPQAVPDASLQVATCPHPLRELEALRDRLLDALAADPSLQVHEIAVLAPDINLYAPFLDAAFGSEDPGRALKFHVIDLDLGRENTWFQALDALLALVSGTVDRPTLFALVDTPAFQETWDVEPDERALWLDYTEEVSAWREEEGDTQSWSHGAERLFTGWFRPEGSPPPLSVTPSAFRSLGRFHRLISDLKARGRDARRSRPLVEWVRFLDQLFASFVGTGDGTGSVLSGRLRALTDDETELPWSGFRAFVQDQIAHFSGRRGQLHTEGVHCSSLRPLRAIPFKVIAVLGLDEGRFPRNTPTPSFDLRRFEPGQDAVSSAALDRYSFWETVMAAQNTLYLSYQGRAPEGDRPPSSVLSDLLELLDPQGRWPVTPVTVKDFSVREGEATWSPRTQRRAAALGAPRENKPAERPSAPPVDEVFPEVRTTEVVQAFTVPARFHLQRVLQIRLSEEDRRGIEDEEPWSLTFLERQSWLQEGLRRSLAGVEERWDVDAFLARLTATGRIRPGVFTERDRRELTRQAGQVSGWALELSNAGWVADETPRERRLWAGRPWAVEPRDGLLRGRERLVPRVLFSEKAPMRTQFDAALRLLLEPSPTRLVTLAPSGRRDEKQWAPDSSRTADLAQHAEDYWSEAASRPLPYYPDYLEAVADRRSRFDEPWPLALEEAWQTVQEARVQSSSTLTRCPYARLAFADTPDWNAVAADLARWWEPLFVPLLEAWQ